MARHRIEAAVLALPVADVLGPWRDHLLREVLIAALPLMGRGEAHDEAVHDLRVTLRRLHSVLGAWAPLYDQAELKPLLRDIRALSRKAGKARDIEVGVAAIQQLSLPDEVLEVFKPHLRQLRRDFRRRLRKLAELLQQSLPALAEGLVDLPPPSTHKAFGHAFAPLLAELAQQLEHNLQMAGPTGDSEQAHEARLIAKRLRYLIDPLAPALPVAARLVRALAKLQDGLGELHDAQLLQQDLAAIDLPHRARTVVATLLDSRIQSCHAELAPLLGAAAIGRLAAALALLQQTLLAPPAVRRARKTPRRS